MVEHQLEYQTGLILPKSPMRNDEISNIMNTTMEYKPIASDILQVLRSLRDSNPSLARKLGNSQVDSEESKHNLLDDSIDYWNKYQQLVVLDQEELTEIHLGGLMVRIIDIRPFLEALDENKISLCTVDFGGTDVGMDNFLLGMRGVRQRTWKKLYLGGCGIGSRGREGVDDLAKIITLCPELCILDLRYNDLSGEDMEKLENSLTKDCKVSVLYLEGNRLTCKGAEAIGRIIANNGHLRELYLGSNGIGVDGARALAKGLEQSSSLQKLYLEGNAIADEGALAFTNVLLSQSRTDTKVLQHLYVDNNGLGKDAATKLGRALNSEGLIGGSFFG
jgi:Ran GTPase-activating protein (RanGAP) involved in mRNA processing and transport